MTPLAKIINSLLWATAIVLVAKFGNADKQLVWLLITLATCSIFIPDRKSSADEDKTKPKSCFAKS